MSVYKEFYSAADQILKASRRIWEDSADWGTPVKKGDATMTGPMAQILRYFDKTTDKREEFRYATGSSVSIYITVFNEWTGSMDEETWKITYTAVRNNKSMDGIISLEVVSIIKSEKYIDY